MTDLTLVFSRPWLLLLLIPAVALTLIPYFLMPKRYRRTRNRIVSIVLHSIVMVLCITVLAGIHFEYMIPNTENELILLVDVSDTSEEAKEDREWFMQTVIANSYGFKTGIVTFGFDQVYAAPLSYDMNELFSQYQSAELPDTSATDIAGALRYASSLLSFPNSAKIVLISDGKETDERAETVIRSISAQGIKVDTVFLNSGFENDNVQVVGVEYPEYHVNPHEDCTINVSLNSKVGARAAVIKLYDNGVCLTETDELTTDIPVGTQIFPFTRQFTEEGLHQIRIEVTTAEEDDGLGENNVYNSYFYIDVFKDVLIIDRGKQEGESDLLKTVLTDQLDETDISYNVEILKLESEQTIPSTVEELLKYDQIILNNISSDDLEKYGLDSAIFTYVNEYGGGLFTVGGNDENGEAHAYNREDLFGTQLQRMLPVQAIDYTPPIGVVFLIDTSGSMIGPPLEQAKNGAIYCLEALTNRDYVGVVSLATNYQTEIQLTSRTEDTAIKEAIRNINGSGATNYSNAIIRAARALIAEKRISKRHIIILTDGQPTEDESNYLPYVTQFYNNNGITFSAVGIGMGTPGAQGALQNLVAAGHGHLYTTTGSEYDLLTAMRRDITAKEIRQEEQVDFHPQVANRLSPVMKGITVANLEEKDNSGETVTIPNAIAPKLQGFYGTMARESADTVLVGDYEVPIYAQWKFGAGMVGSFMCDLSGNWSGEFLDSEDGKRFVRNIVSNLMPTADIRPTAIRVTLEEDNYINRLRIFTTLGEGESFEGTITDSEGVEIPLNKLPEGEVGEEADVFVTDELDPESHYSSCSFVVKRGGTYKITVTHKAKDGTVLSTTELYKSFSYSEEYAPEPDGQAVELAAFMQKLAEDGNGKAVELDDPAGVFAGFVPGEFGMYDPALVFMIIAAICFLADIAVRKFKFKWPHEIIRSIKEKRAANSQ